MLRIGIIVTLFLVVQTRYLACAQQSDRMSKIDSLKQQLPQKTIEGQFEVLWALAVEHLDFENEKALEYAVEARNLAKNSGDSLRMVRAGNAILHALRRLHRTDEAIQVGTESLQIANRNKFGNEVIKIKNSLAVTYIFVADYDDALKLLFENLNISEQGNDNENVVMAIANIGLVFYKMKNYSKAQKYFVQAINTGIKLEDKSAIARLHINVGLCQTFLKDYDLALKSTYEGLAICGSACSPSIQIEGNFGLGVAHFGLNRILEARTFFQESYLLAKANNDYRFQSDNLIYLGKIASLDSNQKQALMLLEEAAQIAKEYSYNELLLSAYEELIRVSEPTLARHVFYQEHYIALREKIYNAELIENLSKVEADFLERENLAQIEHQKKMIVLDDELIRKQQLVAISIGAILFLIMVLVLILYRNNRFKRKINKLLDHKVLERSQELKQSIESLEQIRSEQRVRIHKALSEVSFYAGSLKEICEQILNQNPEGSTQECVHRMKGTIQHLESEISRELEEVNLNSKTES